MAKLTNKELVEKAVIVTDALAAAGKLNPAQSNKFIDYVVDETVLKGNVRVIRFRNEQLDIDKIGVGQRVSFPKSEAVDPGVRVGVNTSKISLVPKTIITPFEISDEFREHNIEGDDVEDHIIRMMAKQIANDLEDFCINANLLGPANLESLVKPGGSNTLYVKDTFLGLVNGWSELAESAHLVDAQGANIGLNIFSQAIQALPTKFRRNMRNLRWIMSPNLDQLYQEKLATRATALGDSAAGGGAENHGPFGIPKMMVPLWQFEPQIVEHIVLNGTATTALKNAPVSDVVVHAETLGSTPTAPYILTTDYVLDATAGTIARNGAGAIGDGATVKVTYNAQPQMLLTHLQNLIAGIGRDIRIERDRDIYKGVNQYAITTKMATQIEEVDALVKVKNIGLSI